MEVVNIIGNINIKNKLFKNILIGLVLIAVAVVILHKSSNTESKSNNTKLMLSNYLSNNSIKLDFNSGPADYNISMHTYSDTKPDSLEDLDGADKLPYTAQFCSMFIDYKCLKNIKIGVKNESENNANYIVEADIDFKPYLSTSIGSNYNHIYMIPEGHTINTHTCYAATDPIPISKSKFTRNNILGTIKFEFSTQKYDNEWKVENLNLVSYNLDSLNAAFYSLDFFSDFTGEELRTLLPNFDNKWKDAFEENFIGGDFEYTPGKYIES
ncbi:MAG: hypothetical protein RR942_15775 [Romboutsia sp.]